MTSLYGFYEIFDYSAIAAPNVVSPPKYVVENYPPDSVMGKIHKQSPKMTYLIRLAGLDGQFADPQNRFTFFLPLESSLDDDLVKRCDKQTARNFVKYHTSMGFLPEAVLRTSRLYHLRSTIKGFDILVKIDRLDRLTLNDIPFVSMDNFCDNGIIHFLKNPLSTLHN